MKAADQEEVTKLLEEFEQIRRYDEKHNDHEEEHIMADAVLLKAVPPEIKQAYEKLAHDIGFWYA